jgi:hypothetical protein
MRRIAITPFQSAFEQLYYIDQEYPQEGGGLQTGILGGINQVFLSPVADVRLQPHSKTPERKFISERNGPWQIQRFKE